MLDEDEDSAPQRTRPRPSYRPNVDERTEANEDTPANRDSINRVSTNRFAS